LEYNLAASEIDPTANWTLSPETDRAPLLSLGTSSDRIFTKKGEQSYYVTFAKGIVGLPLAPYVSISYSEADRGLAFPFGVNIGLTRELDLMPMYDGRRTHLLLTYKQPGHNLTLMAVDLKKPKFGISVGWGF